MNTTKFKKALQDQYEDWPRNPTPKAPIFTDICNMVKPLSTPTILALLNFAVTCMDPDEIYLEAGTAQGGTLIGALRNHPTVKGVSIDNFSQNFTWQDKNQAQQLIRRNVDMLLINDPILPVSPIELVYSDTKEYLLKENYLNAGVYFYDADHSREMTFDCLVLGMSHMAPGGIMIVDDASMYPVRSTIDDFILATKYTELFFFDAIEEDQQKYWHAGLSILYLPS